MTVFAIRRSPGRAPRRDSAAPAAGSREGRSAPRRRGLVAALASWALALAGGLLAGGDARGQAAGAPPATPPGTALRNVATASVELAPGVVQTIASNEVAVVAVPPRTAAQVQFLRASPDSAGDATALGPARCRAADGTFSDLPPPQLLGGAVLDPARPAGVALERIFHGGEPAFLRVLDADQNLDATRRDTVDVRVESPVTGDAETIRLLETGPSTGEFTGWVPTRVAPAASGDCALSVARASAIDLRYADALDARDVARAAALVNPQGTVFDARTGRPVNGARLRLVDAATGLPASVLGDDGRSAFPGELTSGATATDAGGTLYQFPPGGFRFPLVARPGTYRLVVEPPPGLAFPSTVAVADLQRLPGAPFLLAEGSFGRDYAVVSPAAVTLDVPVDAVGGPLAVTKSAALATAAIGDAVQYAVTVTNTGGFPVREVVVDDELPVGFRYARGSARLAGGAAAREIAPTLDASGRGLVFRLGDLPAGQAATLTYVARIGAGTPVGTAINRARARGERVASNAAEAAIVVRDDLFRTRGFVLGRLAVGECDAPEGAGVANVRVYLADGRYAVTDEGGRFHFEDLAPGPQVVQLDRTTFPAGHEPVACGTASTAEPTARLLELRAGGLARADFRFRVRAGEGGLRAPLGAEGLVDAARPVTATGTPDPEVLERMPRIDSLLPGREWLLPSAGFAPPVPAVHVAVKHAPRETVELSVNGAPAAAVLRDGTLLDARRTVAVSRWRGVPLVEGDNALVAVIRDDAGREVARLERTLAYGGSAVRAELDREASRLVADGRSRPLVVLRVYDRHGHAARPGTQGTFRVEPPHRAWSEVESLRDNPLTAVQPREPTWVAGSDGRVRLELEPTSQAGAAVVRLRLGQAIDQEVRAWLAPEARDWILVGLASGTAARNAVDAHAEPLPAGAPAEGWEEDGRVAFFAKGRVRGDWLLTVAYDSARERAVERERIAGTIDPQAYYTLYGDATESRHDAPSQRRLYLKLERREFVALFGDFATGFTVTELARYARVLNGFRVEDGVGAFRAQAFAARGAQALGRDVFAADGSSGPFRLRAGGLVVGSESVRVEVRERFRSEVVVDTRTLQRHLDYDLDWRSGTLVLRRPLASRDEELNPVWLVVEYELPAAADAREHTTGGLRATAATADGRIEAGATAIVEGGPVRRGLAGVDARARLGAVELRAEAARSEARDVLDPVEGTAWLAEATHVGAALEGRAYAREQDAGFGLGQQAATEGGTRKVGAEAGVRLDGRWSVAGQAYEQSSLGADASRRLGEAELRLEVPGRSAQLGVRTARDDVEGERARSDQVYAGVAQDVLDGRVQLRASAERGLGDRDPAANFPDRARIGADWRLTPDYRLFVDYEHADDGAGDSGGLWRAGARAEPWAGGQLESALNAQATENGSRLYSSLGVTQGWRAGERWSFDLGLDRADTLRASGTPLPGTSAGPEGNGFGEAAAVSPSDSFLGAGGAGGGFAPVPASDFTSAFVGAAYRGADWSVTGRAEHRDAREGDQLAVTLGAYREVGAGRAFSLALRFVDGGGTGAADVQSTDARLSWAWRPDGSRWLVLDRLDLVRETAGEATSARLVNNLHANLRLDAATQVGAQLGLRWAEQRYDGADYDGLTVLGGLDLRRDLGTRWDVGLQAARLETRAAGTSEYSAGLDVGRRFGRQLWVSLGWNVVGFGDRDFARDRYTARGPYLRFRAHVDQEALRALLDQWRPGTPP